MQMETGRRKTAAPLFGGQNKIPTSVACQHPLGAAGPQAGGTGVQTLTGTCSVIVFGTQRVAV